MLMAVSCRSPVRTQIYISEIANGTHLDSSLLQCVDSIRDALLQLVLDSRRAEQLKILLNDFGGTVKGIRSARQLRCGIIVHGGPLAVLVLRDVPVGEAKSPQTFCGVILASAKPLHDSLRGGPRWAR